MSDISDQIWDMKYRLKSPDGVALDKDIAQTWARVALAAAHAEAPAKRAQWAKTFAGALTHHKFLPAGRILAGAGTDRNVTLFNCFVMGAIEDSMDGIFSHLREAALTLQQGGGIGYDFSTLRPHGALVKGVGADASGPTSFMDVWDAMCRTIMSAGSRRGAMMATLSCDHPDIEDFIAAKQTRGRLSMFNLSVLVSDAFMLAVKQDRSWNLVFAGKIYRTIRARDLWDKIMRATYDYAEPGVIFIDRINELNNLSYCETIRATNPCGEQPLPPYGACLLGSINLARLVRDPFTPSAQFDIEGLRSLTATAVRFLDNVIEISRFPLPEQRIEAFAKRRIGLGVTGLADALIMMRARYGSPQSIALIETWLAELSHSAYRASAQIAAEKGAFPLFDADEFLSRPHIAALPADIRGQIAQHGIRNGLVTSIAPTGTISLFAGNVSSGIEPVFAFTHNRTILRADGSRGTETVEDYALRDYRARYGAPDRESQLPDYFVDAQSLSPEDHLAVQAAAQKYIDSSISKTINVPKDISFEAFKNVYLRAYDMGCKGCTTYRPNDVTGAVLETVKPQEEPKTAPIIEMMPPPIASEEPVAPSRPARENSDARVPRENTDARVPRDGGVVYMTQPLARPDVLIGQTYKIKWLDSDHAFYITVNDIEKDGRRRPFEVFINSKNMEAYAWAVALTRMISAVFRRGGDVSFVVEELKSVFDPRGGMWMSGHYVPSLMAAIGDVIEKHLVEIGFMSGAEEPLVPPDARAVAVAAEGAPARFCPRCSSASFVKIEGCDNCLSCGYSKCS
jgi:ribonucleoside-diphosphate reductase alpha chain